MQVLYTVIMVYKDSRFIRHILRNHDRIGINSVKIHSILTNIGMIDDASHIKDGSLI